MPSPFENQMRLDELDYSDVDTIIKPPKTIRLDDFMSLSRNQTIGQTAADSDFADGVFEVSQEQRVEWAKKGPIGLAESWRRQDKSEMIPFNPESAVKGSILLGSVKALRDPNTTVETKDFALKNINNYLEKWEEERTRGFTIGGRVIQGVSQLPSFMIEFLATSGLASFGKQAIKQGVQKIAGDIIRSRALNLTTRGAALTAGAGIRTLGMPHRIASDYADRQLNASLEMTDSGVALINEAQEAPLISFFKAYGNIWIENLSEVFGPVLTKAAGKIIPTKTIKAFAGKVIPPGLMSNFARIYKRLHPTESVKKMFTAVGWHGFVEELGEEGLGSLMRAITGIETFGAEDPDSMLDRVISSIPDAEEALVTLAVLAVPGPALTTISKVGSTINLIRDRKDAFGMFEAEDSILTEEQIDSIVAAATAAAQPLAGQAGFARISPEDLPGDISKKIGGEVKKAVEEKRITEDQANQIRSQADVLFESFNKGEIDDAALRQGLVVGYNNITAINRAKAPAITTETPTPSEGEQITIPGTETPDQIVVGQGKGATTGVPQKEGDMLAELKGETNEQMQNEMEFKKEVDEDVGVTNQDIEATKPRHIKKAMRNARTYIARIIQGGGVNPAAMIENGFEMREVTIRRGKRKGKKIRVWGFPPGFVREDGHNFDIHAQYMEGEGLLKTQDSEELVRLVKAGELLDEEKMRLSELEFGRRIKEQEAKDREEAEQQSAEEEAAREILELQKQAFEMGVETTLKRNPVLDAALLERRISRARAAQIQFGLSDANLKSISDRDFRLMSDSEFEAFLINMEAKAVELTDRLDVKARVLSEIKDKNLKRWENLVRVLGLPQIEEMSIEQLRGFEKTLEQYRYGDVFLPERNMRTVDRTDLKGIRTIREARENLAAALGIPVGEVAKIKLGGLERFMWDSALAEQNVFFKRMVTDVIREFLIADTSLLNFEKELDRLTKAARSSRKKNALTLKGLADILIPTDDLVTRYLEGDELAIESMTAEEMALANFLQAHWQSALDYLIQMEAIGKGRENYMTYIRRSFLEAAKEDGIIKAFKEVMSQFKGDEMEFEIRETPEGKTLNLSKYFRFATRRYGAIEPTKNIAKATMAYFRAFEKKKALDKIIPKLDTYVMAIEPEAKDPAGEAFQTHFRKFFNEWMNTKKGITVTLLDKQYGKVDMGLRALRAIRMFEQLAGNIALGVSQPIGEQITTYVNLQRGRYFRGWRRLTVENEKSRRLIDKYRNFVGKSIIQEFAESSQDVGGLINTAFYAPYHEASIMANRIHLLGAMTEEEWQSEAISDERLAEMQLEAGRFRVVKGGESVLGATTEGKFFTAYKRWAFIPLARVYKDIKVVTKAISERKGNVASMRETRELIAAAEITLFTFILLQFFDDDDDKTFIGQMITKVKREALTILGALNPITWTAVPADITFFAQLGQAIGEIILWEKYKTKEGLVGVNRLKRLLIPRFIKQFIPQEEPKKRVKIKY